MEAHNEGEFTDDLVENLSTSEFETFFKVVLDLNLHMVLNDPQITLDLVPHEQRAQQSDLLTRFDFFMFFKQDYYCIDGFPTEGMPAVVVLPTPLRDGYVYQGLKPAVIVFNQDNLEDADLFPEGAEHLIKDHITQKHQQQQERQRAKRAVSVVPRDAGGVERGEEEATASPPKRAQTVMPPSQPTAPPPDAEASCINIRRVKVSDSNSSSPARKSIIMTKESEQKQDNLDDTDHYVNSIEDPIEG